MAGPAVGRSRTGRPGETEIAAYACRRSPGASADAGSIPAASTRSAGEPISFATLAPPRAETVPLAQSSSRYVMHYGHGYIFFVEQGYAKFGEVIPDLTLLVPFTTPDGFNWVGYGLPGDSG